MNNYENIPAELQALNQWVAWTKVDRTGKKRKLPIDPKTGQMAKTNDPSTWGTFEQACAAGKKLDGIGFVFTSDDPFCGIDMDQGIDYDLIDWFNSYAECSQSGTGAHIIVKAIINGGHKNGKYEIYDKLRYFIFTGDIIKNKPIREAQEHVDTFMQYCFPDKQKQDDDIDLSVFFKSTVKVDNTDVLDRIRNSAQGYKFDLLWAGNIGQYNSNSEADAALLSILRFWTGGNKGESLALFSQSALGQRKKWSRADYQDRTWTVIDSGDVYQPIVINDAEVDISPLIKRQLSPWRNVTTKTIEQVIQGTALQPLVDMFEAPMNPGLPLEATLLKSLVMAGCALCKKKSGVDEPLFDLMARGIDLAKVKIMSARGQACNIYGLLVAQSGVGKDIGNLIDLIALQREWMIGSSGSAEGLADTLSNEKIDRSSGYLAISEFSNWLDKHHWQSKAAPFLTDAFNRGWFSHAMSSRGKKSKQREAKYCYPSILANVQPESITKYANTIDIASGFLSRFLISRVPDDYFGRPACGEFSDVIDNANHAIDSYMGKSGNVHVGDGYLDSLHKMFVSHKAGIRSHWSRLINEYGPRFAVMLSVTPGDLSPEIELNSNDWEGAELMIQWFYSMAIEMLGQVEEDTETAKREALLNRIFNVIKSRKNCTTRDISFNTGRGSTKKTRYEALIELEDRGKIISIKEGKKTIFKVR